MLCRMCVDQCVTANGAERRHGVTFVIFQVLTAEFEGDSLVGYSAV
jgi:hypothetical protein